MSLSENKHSYLALRFWLHSLSIDHVTFDKSYTKKEFAERFKMARGTLDAKLKFGIDQDVVKQDASGTYHFAPLDYTIKKLGLAEQFLPTTMIDFKRHYLPETDLLQIITKNIKPRMVLADIVHLMEDMVLLNYYRVKDIDRNTVELLLDCISKLKLRSVTQKPIKFKAAAKKLYENIFSSPLIKKGLDDFDRIEILEGIINGLKGYYEAVYSGRIDAGISALGKSEATGERALKRLVKKKLIYRHVVAPSVRKPVPTTLDFRGVLPSNHKDSSMLTETTHQFDTAFITKITKGSEIEFNKSKIKTKYGWVF